MLHALRGLTLCVALGLVAAQPAVAAPQALTADELRAAARAALKTGQPDVTIQLATALVARDPGDVSALLLLARAQRDVGAYRPALTAAKQAWSAAETDLQHYASAVVIAQVYSSSGARTRAQIWLRRAAETAPDDRLKAKAVKDFRYVRDRNPWTTNLSFAITPSSNINNGSKSEIVEIDGLPFVLSGDARALSGMEYRFDIDTEVSRQMRDNLWVFAAGDVSVRRYSLSGDAKQQAPNLDASDLNYTEAELTLGFTVFPTPKSGPLTVSAAAGRGWYAGDPLVDFYTISADQTVLLSPADRLNFMLVGNQQNRVQDPINNSQSWTLQTAWSHKRRNADSMNLAFSISDTASDGAAVANQAWSASVAYARAKPIAGAQISFALSYEDKLYDRPYFSSERRADQTATAEISLFLPKVELYGFAPEISFLAKQSDSNVGLYETVEYGMSVGIRSTF